VPPAPPAEPAPELVALKRRAVSGFTLYDVANSAFVTTVVTAIGGPFLTALAEAAADDDGRLGLLGLNPRAGALFAYAVSLSVMLQVVALPLLGALADRPATKRRVLVGSTWAGSLATFVLAVAPGPLIGLAAFIVANVGYGCAIMVYNAYLADVAEAADRDRVSARGFAFGYAGGGFMLALALALLTAAGPLGLERGTAVRVAIAVSGPVVAARRHGGRAPPGRRAQPALGSSRSATARRSASRCAAPSGSSRGRSRRCGRCPARRASSSPSCCSTTPSRPSSRSRRWCSRRSCSSRGAWRPTTRHPSCCS
jgi:UMF1 family MFS transporter